MYYKVRLYRKEEKKFVPYGEIITKKTIYGMKEVMTNYKLYTEDSDSDYDFRCDEIYGDISREITSESEIDEYINSFEDSKFYQYYINRKSIRDLELVRKKEQKDKSKQEKKKIKNRIKEVRGTYK